MLSKYLFRIHLLVILTTAFPTSVPALGKPAGNAVSCSEGLSRECQLLDPDLFHQVIPFALLAYEIDKLNLLDNRYNNDASWHFSAIQGETGIKGANILKPAISAAANYFLSSNALDNVDLEEVEQSGLLALRQSGNTPGQITAVIAFNGTRSVPGMITDINAVKTDLPMGLTGQGHTGFVNAACSSYSAVKQTLTHNLSAMTGIPLQTPHDIADSGIQLDLIIMGHSLGGAKALLTASYLFKELDLASADHQNIRLFVITLGGPRVFDHAAAAAIDRLFGKRIIAFVAYPFDIVPHVPFERSGYKHVGQTVTVPVLAHIKNLEPINTLYNAYYGDQNAINVLADKTTQYAASDKDRDAGRPYSSYLSPSAIMELTRELGMAWHRCKHYVATIIRDKIYQRFYYDALQPVGPEAGSQNQSDWGALVTAIARYGIQKASQLLQTNAVPAFLFLSQQKQG